MGYNTRSAEDQEQFKIILNCLISSGKPPTSEYPPTIRLVSENSVGNPVWEVSCHSATALLQCEFNHFNHSIT